MVAFDPSVGIDKKREACSMAFEATIGAETLYLTKAALDEIVVIDIGPHP